MTEKSLNSWHDSCLTAEINDLTVLSDGQCTDNYLVRVLIANHVPKLVHDGLEGCVVGDADSKASCGSLALEIYEVEEHLGS